MSESSMKFPTYIVVAGIMVLALVVGAFVYGRYSVPEKVVEIEKIVTVEKQVIVEKIDEKKLEELTLQVKTALTKIEQLKKSIHKEKTSTTYPDGRIESKEVVDINVDRTVQTTEVKEVEKQVVVVQEKLVDRIVEVEKQVMVEHTKIVSAPKPDWKAGAMVGMNVKEVGIGQGLTTGPFAFGAQVDRRIAGPVFVGAWGLTSGQAGLTLSAEF